MRTKRILTVIHIEHIYAKNQQLYQIVTGQIKLFMYHLNLQPHFAWHLTFPTSHTPPSIHHLV